MACSPKPEKDTAMAFFSWQSVMTEPGFIVSKCRRLASVAAITVFTSALCFGGLIGSASADEHDRNRRDDRHGDHRRHDWDRGHYRAPRVVYHAPDYALPLVYGPDWGLNVNIR
jgi:hypothetical protein